MCVYVCVTKTKQWKIVYESGTKSPQRIVLLDKLVKLEWVFLFFPTVAAITLWNNNGRTLASHCDYSHLVKHFLAVATVATLKFGNNF